jgi:hypothetical protein
MKDCLAIEHPDPGSLTIKKTRWGGLRNAISVLGVLTFWYGILLGPEWLVLRQHGRLPEGLTSLGGWVTLLREVAGDNPCLWVFLLAPLLFLPPLIGQLKISLVGDVLVLNGTAETISRDGRHLALFSESEGVQLRTVRDDEGRDTHRVSVLLSGGASLIVTESDEVEQMATLADDIARVLNTPVVKAGP